MNNPDRFFHVPSVFPLAQRRTAYYRTMCGDSVSGKWLWAPGGTRNVTCPKCITRLHMQRQSLTAAMQTALPNSDHERLLWRALQSISEALGIDQASQWLPCARHNYREVGYVVFRKGDRSFYTWGLSSDAPDKDNVYLSASDAEHAARAYIEDSLSTEV